MPKIVQVVSLALVLMAVAFLFPAIISGMNDGNAQATVTVGNGSGDVVYVEDALRVRMVSQTSNQATLNVTSVGTGDSEQFVIDQGETVQYQIDNSTITTEALNVDNSENSALLQFTYPVSMGWTPESAEISRNLPVVFVLIPLVIVAGFIAAVVRS